MTNGLVEDPRWDTDRLWGDLDFLEDDCIDTLGGMSLLAALRAKEFSPAYYAAHMLRAIARIRTARKLYLIDEAICAAIEYGDLLAEQCAYWDARWALGERRLKVRGNAALATHGTPEERKKRKERVLGLFNDAMCNGAQTYDHAYTIVAEKVGCSPRTVRRVVTGS
jgi:hypothetical protein